MRLFRESANFLIEQLIDLAPGGSTLRPALHRIRGVRIRGPVFISRRVTLETKFPGKISIGTNVFIGIGTTILAHHDTAEDMDDVTVDIANNVYVGPHCVILPGASIGANSVVAAGSVVNRTIPANRLVRGNPASTIADVTVPLGLDGDHVAFTRGLSNFRK